jgi:hypothetical protein
MKPVRLLALAVVALLPLAVGCNSNNEGKIEGTRWSSQKITMRGQNIPDAAGMLKINFNKDGRVTYITPQGTFTGTYTLGWGDNVTLNFNRELGGLKSHTESVSIDGKQMTMTDSDGTSAVFGLLGKN